MAINSNLYGRLYNGDCVVFQVVKNIDMSNAIMLDSRLGHVLSKKAGEFESFLVEENKMWAKRLDLLLLCAAVNQSWIVAKGDGEKSCLNFD